MFYTSVILRLETGSATTQACFYCGDKLRIAYVLLRASILPLICCVSCTLIDSERTQSTLGSGPQFENLSANYFRTLQYIQDNRVQLSSSGVTGVLSFNYTSIPGVSSSILPEQFTTAASSNYLYTPNGPVALTLAGLSILFVYRRSTKDG